MLLPVFQFALAVGCWLLKLLTPELCMSHAVILQLHYEPLARFVGCEISTLKKCCNTRQSLVLTPRRSVGHRC